jgi:hypothetical protein
MRQVVKGKGRFEDIVHLQAVQVTGYSHV